MASNARGRVLLACDSCRQRKSRCDGLRPRCGHCQVSGQECRYRTASAGLDSDISILSRLAETEARLQALEEKNHILAASILGSQHPANGDQLTSLELFGHEPLDQSSHPQHINKQRGTPLSGVDSGNGHARGDNIKHANYSCNNGTYHPCTPPDLHTAAAYKLLTCWPRLTINMTIPQLDSQAYLTQCDQADPLLLEAVALSDVEQLTTWQASLALETLYSPSVYRQLPLAMAALLETYPGLNREYMMASISGAAVASPIASPDDMEDVMDVMTVAAATTPSHPSYYTRHRDAHQNAHHRLATLNYSKLSFAQLLMLSIAMRVAASNPTPGYTNGSGARDPSLELGPDTMMAIATHTCSLALQKTWTLQAGPCEDLVPLTLMLANYLVHFWVRPFHAKGLLQSIDPAIKQMSKLRAEDPRLSIYARLHFTLESDIITELNGFCTLTSATILKVPPLEGADAVESAPADAELARGSGRARPTAFHIDNHVRLRIFLNRVLHLLYAPTKAYAQPHELADIVCSLSAGLRDWYQSQPLDQQFVRDATIFSINLPSMNLRLREAALRYFGCSFLLHRPVLYFFLHKDLEYTVRPPENVRTLHVDREPWVLESCRDCIESAALIIHVTCLTAQERSAGDPTFAGPDGHADGPPPIGTHAAAGVEDAYESWCGLQMLFAAYLLLLQVRTVPSLMPVFRNIGDIDHLLDKVERAFGTSCAVPSLILDKSLAILQDERRNFEAASPLAHMT